MEFSNISEKKSTTGSKVKALQAILINIDSSLF